MGTHMKTTIEIAEPLLRRAKRVAQAEGRTLRELVEEGLRAALARRASSTPFRLRDASVGGKGLQTGAAEASWEELRALAYEGRGG
jgi:hypothetical protein